MNPEFLKVLVNTVVVKMPRLDIETFGTTIVTYNMITRPLYEALETDKRKEESVLRRGTVKAERPQIVTPGYMARSTGFRTEAEEFMRDLIRRGHADDPGILYTYSNEPASMEIISARPEDLAERIGAEVDRESRPREAVILGVDELWDVSLMKFIFDLTNKSAPANVADFQNTGRLSVENGVPMDARIKIDRMFVQMRNGELDPSTLHQELEAWQLFDQYEDRFFQALRGRSL